MRAAIYCRISKDREGQEMGVQRQEAECKALCERLEVKVIETLVDNDISASTKSRKERPAYKALLQGAREGHWDTIVAWSTSRLTRRPLELEGLLELAEEYGVRFIFVKSPHFDPNTAHGRMIARVLAATDAAEAESTAERIVSQKRQAATAGRWRGGPRPYGYDTDGVTLVPEEARWVAWATRQVLSGASLNSVATALNERGVRPVRGGKWGITTLKQVLVRARNAGLVEYRGEVVATAEWEPIVPRAEWEAVRRLVESRRRGPRPAARRWLGSGLYLCGVCDDGTRVTSGWKYDENARIPLYRCPNMWHLARQALQTDEVVEEAVFAYLSRPDVASRLAQPDRAIGELEKRAKELNAILDEAADMYAARIWDRARIERVAAHVRPELEQIEREIAKAVSRHPANVLLTAKDIRAKWRDLDVSRRQAIVSELMVVTLHKAKPGRPSGWRPGQPYFDVRTVQIDWR